MDRHCERTDEENQKGTEYEEHIDLVVEDMVQDTEYKKDGEEYPDSMFPGDIRMQRAQARDKHQEDNDRKHPFGKVIGHFGDDPCGEKKDEK
jgi:hypothetical protein